MSNEYNKIHDSRSNEDWRCNAQRIATKLVFSAMSGVPWGTPGVPPGYQFQFQLGHSAAVSREAKSGRCEGRGFLRRSRFQGIAGRDSILSPNVHRRRARDEVAAACGGRREKNLARPSAGKRDRRQRTRDKGTRTTDTATQKHRRRLPNGHFSNLWVLCIHTSLRTPCPEIANVPIDLCCQSHCCLKCLRAIRCQNSQCGFP